MPKLNYEEAAEVLYRAMKKINNITLQPRPENIRLHEIKQISAQAMQFAKEDIARGSK